MIIIQINKYQFVIYIGTLKSNGVNAYQWELAYMFYGVFALYFTVFVIYPFTTFLLIVLLFTYTLRNKKQKKTFLYIKLLRRIQFESLNNINYITNINYSFSELLI